MGELLSRIQWNHLKIFPYWRLITFSGGSDDQAEVHNLPWRFILTLQRLTTYPWGADDLGEVDNLRVRCRWPRGGWQLTREVQMTSRRLMFIQLSQLTRCPLYVSPFFSSTSCQPNTGLHHSSQSNTGLHRSSQSNTGLHHSSQPNAG